MFCGKCGLKIEEGSRFCGKCGAGIECEDASLDVSEVAVQEVPIEQVMEERQVFVIHTFMHFLFALVGFVALSFMFNRMDGSARWANRMTEGFNWLFVLLGHFIASWVADKWAHSSTDRGLQYAGLGLYVVAEAIIFLPLLMLADNYAPSAIPQAATMTIGLVCAIAYFVVKSKQRFDWLRDILFGAGIITLGIIVSAIIFGLNLGFLFSVVMVVIGAGSLVYQLDAILNDYNDEQYVGAALGLFSSVMLIFWYLLRMIIWDRD